MIFIAHKAIGYFFMKPVTAASVVISLMRVAPNDEVLDELGKLLLNPLLMNYPGSVRQYLARAGWARVRQGEGNDRQGTRLHSKNTWKGCAAFQSSQRCIQLSPSGSPIGATCPTLWRNR